MIKNCTTCRSEFEPEIYAMNEDGHIEDSQDVCNFCTSRLNELDKNLKIARLEAQKHGYNLDGVYGKTEVVLSKDSKDIKRYDDLISFENDFKKIISKIDTKN
jgi:hypothetical protein